MCLLFSLLLGSAALQCENDTVHLLTKRRMHTNNELLVGQNKRPKNDQIAAHSKLISMLLFCLVLFTVYVIFFIFIFFK